MADPRKVTAYDEIGFGAETFSVDNSTITYSATAAGGAAATMIGKAVSLSADRTVALCADGDAVLGKLILVEPDGKCTVQTRGYVTLPAGASATVTRGTGIVGALGASSARGYIRSAASGTAAETVKERGIIVDDEATAVVVNLG